MIEDVVVKKMEIHERLGRIQYELTQESFSKSGHNAFGGFDYYELEDIQPMIIKKCYNYHVTIRLGFSDREAYIKLVSWENPQDFIIETLKMPELKQLPKMNLPQSEGAYETYFKKYLLRNLFLISAKDEIDSLEANNKSNGKKANKERNGEPIVRPPVIDKLIEQYLLDNEGVVEVDETKLNPTRNKLRQSGQITNEENTLAMKWIHHLKQQGGK